AAGLVEMREPTAAAERAAKASVWTRMSLVGLRPVVVAVEQARPPAAALGAHLMAERADWALAAPGVTGKASAPPPTPPAVVAVVVTTAVVAAAARTTWTTPA